MDTSKVYKDKVMRQINEEIKSYEDISTSNSQSLSKYEGDQIQSREKEIGMQISEIFEDLKKREYSSQKDYNQSIGEKLKIVLWDKIMEILGDSKEEDSIKQKLSAIFKDKYTEVF